MARKKKTITVKGSIKKKQAQKKKGVSQEQSLTVNVITGRRKSSGKTAVKPPTKQPIVFSPVINLGKAENTPAPPAPSAPPVAAANRVSFQIPQTVATPDMVKIPIVFQGEEPNFFNFNFSRQPLKEVQTIPTNRSAIMLQRPENISLPTQYEDETIKLPTNPRDMLEIPIEAVDMLNLPYTKFILPPPIRGNQSVGIPPSSRNMRKGTPVQNIPIAKVLTEEISWESVPSLPVSVPLTSIEVNDAPPPILDDELLPELPISPETVFIKRGKGRPIKVVKNPTPKELKKMEKAKKERERYQNQPAEVRAEKALVISLKNKEKQRDKKLAKDRNMKDSNLGNFFEDETDYTNLNFEQQEV